MKKTRFIIVLAVFILVLSNAFVYGAPKTSLESVALSEAKQRLKTIYNTNNIEEAYKIVSTIPENERDSEIWFLLANISQDLNQTEDAVFYLQKAILEDGNNDKAYYNLGNLYLQRDQNNNAIKMYNEAIRIKKDFAPYYYNLGCAYLKVEDVKKAKAMFSKAVLLNGTQPDYRYNLAYTYKLLGNDKKAQKELDEYNKLTAGQ
ncbi:tetratricopeptide repeat protein [bacterium]|nr:tetratricopeptide repeat protein [bacterium]